MELPVCSFQCYYSLFFSHFGFTGKEEFDEKQKEVEKTVNPIMSKLYAAGGGGGAGGGGSSEDEEMPDHDEL